MPHLTCSTCVTSPYTSAARLLSRQAAEELWAAGPQLCQCGAHVLSQPVVLHQLGVNPPPRHLFFHEATFHYGTQLLLLRHLTLQARHLFTALPGGKWRSHERLANENSETTHNSMMFYAWHGTKPLKQLLRNWWSISICMAVWWIVLTLCSWMAISCILASSWSA